MNCTSPFKMVDNVGCVHLLRGRYHNFAEGISHCQSLGGELYEFENFTSQYQDMFDYLTSNGGESQITMNIFNLNFVFHQQN